VTGSRHRLHCATGFTASTLISIERRCLAQMASTNENAPTTTAFDGLRFLPLFLLLEVAVVVVLGLVHLL
jgi:hypothetical protein